MVLAPNVVATAVRKEKKMREGGESFNLGSVIAFPVQLLQAG